MKPKLFVVISGKDEDGDSLTGMYRFKTQQRAIDFSHECNQSYDHHVFTAVNEDDAKAYFEKNLSGFKVYSSWEDYMNTNFIGIE